MFIKNILYVSKLWNESPVWVLCNMIKCFLFYHINLNKEEKRQNMNAEGMIFFVIV